MGEWFCSPECRKKKRRRKGHKPEKEAHVDSVYQYSTALVFRGLYHMAHRDMIREGNGAAMMNFWKINMPDFWAYNHYKYFIIGHRMLAGEYNILNGQIHVITLLYAIMKYTI